MKSIAVVFVLAYLGIYLANAQPPKTTNCWTESGQWYFNCVDECLEGELSFCFTLWHFKTQNHITLKQKASLIGVNSGDIYTISHIEKLRFKELDNGMTYVKSGILTLSIYRNGEFWAVAHINRHITYNAKGELIVFVDHRIDCD
jgi:hypothetical protein